MVKNQKNKLDLRCISSVQKMLESRDQQCKRCKYHRYRSDFLKEGRELKTCLNCTERARQYNYRNECNYFGRKCECKERGSGLSFCELGTLKWKRKSCDGKAYYSHGNMKWKCLECKQRTLNNI